jgi:hypothetical protein
MLFSNTRNITITGNSDDQVSGRGIRYNLSRLSLVSIIGILSLIFFSVLVILFGKQDLVVALCYAMTLGIVFYFYLKLTAKDSDSAGFLPNIFLFAFGIRACLAIGISLFLKEYVQYDAPMYEASGLLWSNFWHGLISVPPVTFVPHVQLTDEIVGVQYFLSGNNTFVPDLTNAFIGSLIPVIVYNIGRRFLGGERVGRSAAVFATLNAACIIWSSIAVRDIFIIFFITLSLSEFTKLIHRFHSIELVRLGIWLACLNAFRPYAVMILLAVFAITMVVLFSQKPLARFLVVLGCIGFISLVVVSGQIGSVITDVIQTQTDQLSSARAVVSYQTFQDKGYAQDVMIKSPIDLIEFIPAALMYFWAGPFVAGLGVRQVIFALPEIISWYVTFWYGMRGFLYLRGKNKYFVPHVVCFLLGSVLLAVICSNFAETIRMRSMVSVPLQLLAGVGWVRRRDPILACYSRALAKGQKVVNL